MDEGAAPALVSRTGRATPSLAAGQGVIACELVGGRSIVAAARARAPLKLITPRNGGHAAWVTMATFGGGLVDGDAIRIDADVRPGASLLLGTQASTKIYRCPTATSRQDLVARVAPEGLLVVLPDHVACFAGARYEQRISVDLARAASLVLLDAFTCGRSARGERWQFLRFASRLAVNGAHGPLVREAVVLDATEGELAVRFGRFDAFATIVLLGPRVTSTASMIPLAPTWPPRRRAGLVEAVSPVAEGGAIVRVAGASIEEVLAAARARLGGLAALLGDDPLARKW